MNIKLMKKIVGQVEENKIPESFLKGRNIESEEDLDVMVTSFREMTANMKIGEDDGAIKDIEEWAGKSNK